MSDFNQISANTNEQTQEGISLSNDIFRNISISDQKSSIGKNRVNDLENETGDASVITAIVNQNPLKTTTDEDELHINMKLRPRNKKHQDDDEHSEGDEDDKDHQNVPKMKSAKIKELLDDDHNTHSPAYIPRKGKFYEHDDRTLDENHRPKQEISRNGSRFYQDSDAKWQHDLYFRDEQMSKSRYPTARRDHGRFEGRHDYHREQFHLNDYMSRSQSGHDDYHQQQYGHDYRRRAPQETEKKSPLGRANHFDFKDYNRSSVYHRNDSNSNSNHRKELQTVSRQQRHDNHPHQIDERTFHRRRDFTNSQFQQQESNQLRDSNNSRHYERLNKYELSANTKNVPPRFRMNDHYRNSTEKQESHQNGPNMERSKRYSNMRNNITNTIQSQGTSSTQTKHHPFNTLGQNDWPQAPSPPTSYLSKQIITPQMYYQQSISRYVSMNYPQASISEQV